MKAPACVTIDFESDAIQARPVYPPRPVGVAIRTPGRKPRYYAWGHPTENNCTKEEAVAALRLAWADKRPKLFHNAKFDMDVADVHLGLPILPEGQFHDTLPLLFLRNPHSKSLSLKPAAAEILGMEPVERDAVKEWLMSNAKRLEAEGALYVGPIKPSTWGAYIGLAPGKLVGKYAVGDVDRTWQLFEKVWPEIEERGMLEPYNTELKLIPLLLANERKGIRVDVEALQRDSVMYHTALETADNWLRKRLDAPGMNLDSDAEVAAALEACGVVTQWVKTATGKNSTAKKNMTPAMFNDPKVASVLGYRNRLTTCLGTFIDKWAAAGEAGGGWLHTTWNSVRSGHGNDTTGARTGRMSSTPAFMNMPNSFEDKNDGYIHPKFLKSLPPLPLMRKYILPDSPDHEIVMRDFAGQELRVLGHFEDGALQAAYAANPYLDVHGWVKDMAFADFGVTMTRLQAKIVDFLTVYGGGVGKLAETLGVDITEAQKFKDVQNKVITGLKDLNKNLKAIVNGGDPIVTWGGRQYHKEPSALIKGRMVDFAYKMLNYIVQGSSADITKRALLNYDAVKQHGRFLLAVHDEIVLSVPSKHVKTEALILRDAMFDMPGLDVPMLSDCETGPNYYDLVKLVETKPYDFSRWQ